MHTTKQSNELSPSTTLVWELTKIGRPPQGQEHSPRRGRHAWHRLGVWPRRRALTIKVFRANGEPYLFSVAARGTQGWVWGDVSLYDLWCAISNQV